jgi:oligoribonuclease
MSTSVEEARLVWIDCEMTGLEVGKDKIIEVATIITDEHLKELHEGFERTIYCPKETLDNMVEWCIEHHGNVLPFRSL